MQKDKIFKVVEVTEAKGRVWYRVFGYENKLSMLIGFGTEYSKENDSLDSAFNQVEALVNMRVIKERTVCISKVKNNQIHYEKVD